MDPKNEKLASAVADVEKQAALLAR